MNLYANKSGQLSGMNPFHKAAVMHNDIYRMGLCDIFSQ